MRSKIQDGPYRIVNGHANHQQRKKPYISLEVMQADRTVTATINNAIPDQGAEVSVGGLEMISAWHLTEKDLISSAYNLIFENRSTPLLSIEQ